MSDSASGARFWAFGALFVLALLLVGYLVYTRDAAAPFVSTEQQTVQEETDLDTTAQPAAAAAAGTSALAGRRPAVSTAGFASVSSTTAIVIGTVIPGSSETTYWFEYGTTANFGNVVDARSAGAGARELGAAGYLTGLKPGTEYYFRIGAQNAYGRVYGGPYKFITATK